MQHAQQSASRKAAAGKVRSHGLSRLLHIYRHRWFQVFAVGLALLILMEASFLVAKNANLVPAMIIYGAFVVPITYLRGSLTGWPAPISVLAICLLCGGALG